jgi:poly-gamma-glutamate synthesis protein (capsule biosynthesis protein)
VAWLGYTQKMARVTMDYAVAGEDRPGCLPLDPDLVRDDIKAARERADLIVMTPHWGVEGRHTVSPVVRALGRWMIDAGADVVLGHGPHVYQGVEVYRGRPIVYSMGTLVFGLWDRTWKDNIVVRMVLRDGDPARLEIVPVSGIGAALYHPEPLRGDAARRVLQAVTRLSRPFGTVFSIEGDRAALDLAP